MTDFPHTTLAIVFVLLVYFWTSMQVGKARAQHDVKAPASSGHPEFDKRYRVQMNTLETLVLLLPLLFLAAPVLGDLITALLALTYGVGRIIYARAYYRDPASRSAGFGISMLPVVVALVAAIWSGISGILAMMA
ncbi:MAPEG family protein [Sandaracinobacteroides saxicola]|uniref:MAPEG family protein n=1 Tax=Sandaracinobacteroides saxicola TaxID=2759707 RepID=A0A7G5ILS0_9SPHN|nr:MAPEG family protein [Sandaracinobacteroides saxicola]QMW24312.1 MAPEG family protein [Sandaracinobacteroides saxicola]